MHWRIFKLNIVLRSFIKLTNMERTALTCVVVCALMTGAAAVSSVCEGVWSVDKVEKCENHEQYPIVWELKKRKLSRSTDSFTGDIELLEDFGPDYGIRLESYEKCDGGYKASDMIMGGACELLNKFAKKNFEDILEHAEIEPKDCPIKKGKYSVKDYVINYETMPKQGKCGEFKWYAYLTKDGKDVYCVTAYGTFTSTEE